MGIGLSKNTSSSTPRVENDSQATSIPKTLPGTSTPPKGMPPARPNSTSKTTASLAKPKTDIRSESSFNRPKKTRNTTSKVSDNEKAACQTKPPITKSEFVTSEQEKRTKSAAGLHNTRKRLVTQMEMGIENEDDVDVILGLDRMKTQLQLRKEKTRLKAEERNKHSQGKFQDAVLKVQEATGNSTQSENYQIYAGNIKIECPTIAKIVRIFTSSTFTDTTNERNILMEKAYPKIKSFCMEHGYEFQVVDMRWGVRDQATDDNMATELCLRELQLCQKLSTGPNFVSLMSHKYGYIDFPRVIQSSEYETILKHVESDESRQLLNKWYMRDTNADPPVYVVQSISRHLPDFLSTDREKRNAAKNQWMSISNEIHEILERVAQSVLPVEIARKYSQSVTETEVKEGLLNAKDAHKHCLWLRRNIENIEEQESSALLARFIECSQSLPSKSYQKKRDMLRKLKDKVENTIPDNILDYNVSWDHDDGIDPSSDEHKKYLNKMCGDFITKLCAMIQIAMNERQQSEDPLVEEILHHTQFCQDKCRNFHGRETILENINKYIQGISNEPLVIYGESGCGKTSVMAMAAMKAQEWTTKNAVVVLRFIGTTPDSSNVHALVGKVTAQIRKAYGVQSPVSNDLHELMDEFKLSLFQASSQQPLVIILDSLDMIDPSDNSRQLQWLPQVLRSNVKLIVSTLPDSSYECFPILKSTIKSGDHFLNVPLLQEKDFTDMIDNWLKVKQRKLTPEQKTILLDACAKCPLPLFLKLSFDKAFAWTSFAAKNTLVLESTVRQSIDGLLRQLENMHGQKFVSRALGYLTTSRAGLAESEWEDVLSCDDDALNDVYSYWIPPIRRLPPLLLVRLRADLSQYLVDRAADNVRVIYWYHRQFIEASQNRYCNDDAINRTFHGALADFFSGTWADGKTKPFTNSKGDKDVADRHVASQPNMFGNTYNKRKLNNLPFHRCHANQVALLKKEALCNIDFLLHKLKATSLWEIMHDFNIATKLFPDDDLLQNIHDAIHLAQEGLLYDPHQLVSQIIGRLPIKKTTEEFLNHCQQYQVPRLSPDRRILTQPGGQLVYAMAGHKGDILSLDITEDSQVALTCSDDDTIRMWSVKSGQQIHVFEGLGKVSNARFCTQDLCVLIDLSKTLTVRSRRTGDKKYDISSVTDDFPSCLCGIQKSLLIVFKEQVAIAFDLNKNGEIQFQVQCGGQIEFRFPAHAVGSKNLALVNTFDQIYLTVLDVRTKEFSPLYRGFEPAAAEAIREDIQYEIDEMAITADERHVIYSNIYTNDFVFLDLKTKKKTKTIPGDPNDYVRSLKCSLDGSNLYFVKGAFVTFFDIRKSIKSEELEHTVDVSKACTNDMKIIVTTAEDSIVRVWDRTKQAQKINTLSRATNRIRILKSHTNPRYLIGFGLKTRENDSQILFVYDTIKQCSIRERSLDCSILQLEVINSNEILVLHDFMPKLTVLDIDTLKVVREYQGYLPQRKSAFKVIEKYEEVACLSFGRHNVKLYDIKSGKTVAILDTKQTKSEIDGFTVSSNGNVLAAFVEETGQIFIFDVLNRKLMKTFKSTFVFFSECMSFTPDGTYLLFKVEGVPPHSKQKENDIFVEVWNTRKGKKICNLHDMEYYHRYNSEKIKTGRTSAVDTFVILDDKTVITANDDFLMRVYDITSGNMLHRLAGHRSVIEIVYNPNCPYIITYGSWTEENAFRVWDRQTFTSIASYTLDKLVTNLDYSFDGKFIIATIGKPAEIVTWRFNHFQSNFDSSSTAYQETLKGKDVELGELDFVQDDDQLRLDPNDLDKDIVDENTDTSDDDFL